MTIIVSGASGFVGQHLLPRLLASGHRVIGLVHSSRPSLQHEHLDYLQVDLTDTSDVLDKLHSLSADMIIDLAAIIDYDRSRRQSIISRNIDMTRNLVNTALEHPTRYLKVSSIAALGRPLAPELHIDEDTPWDDDAHHSSYAMAKYLSELEVWRGYAEGLEVMVLNPGIILGISHTDAISNSFSCTIIQPQKYYTLGKTLYVDVEDLVTVIELMIAQWQTGEQYIIGGLNISFRELLDTAAQTLDMPPPTRELQPWMSGLFRMVFNLKKKLQGKDGFLSTENVRSLFEIKNYDSSKFSLAFPEFSYTPLDSTLLRIQKNSTES